MATDDPTVSVVLPTYERPAYLKRAAASVDAQTYDDIELIVVDDCSEPPARSALAGLPLESLAAITCLRHETNRGANAARNTGIEAANGEFVAFLDDDDWWKREKIERQVERFHDAGSEVGVVYTGTRYVDVSGADDLVEVSEIEGKVTREMFFGASMAEFSAVMVRASVIETAGLPDERFPSWQDREWYLRLSRHCTFAAVPEPLTVRQQGHGGQISDDYQRKRDVSYPMFLEKHRSLAAEYGPRFERAFVGALTRGLGKAAFRTENYREASVYLARSLRYDPFALDVYPYLLASLGGKRTHRLARRAREFAGTALPL